MMLNPDFWTQSRLAALFFVLSFPAMALGIAMFFGRNGLQGGTGSILERGALVAAVVMTVIGVVFLNAPLQETAGRALSRIGLALYLLAAAALLVPEAMPFLPGGRSVYALIVVYVVLALIAQAAVGGALLQAGLAPKWVGWVTIVWNLGWLIVLPVVTPRDMYYPILHGLMPLIIGISLFR